jgi:E3 ubiquitin-protein ligase UBR1
MGPCTFADLVKRVAERLVDDVSFERVLKEVSRLKFPESITDSGIYELNGKWFDEVTPFFFYYTCDKREEVDTKIRVRLKKVTDVSNPLIVPNPFSVESGPFSEMASPSESVVLLHVMFYSFYSILPIRKCSGVE